MIPATGCKLFHSPPMPGNFARESCPSLNIGDRSQNLNFAPYHLEGRRSDFSLYWLCPTVLHFTGYTKTFFPPVAAQHFMPWAVSPLPRAGSSLCTVLEMGSGPQRNPAYKRALIEISVTLGIALCYIPSYVTGSVPGTLGSPLQCLRSMFKVAVPVWLIYTKSRYCRTIVCLI